MPHREIYRVVPANPPHVPVARTRPRTSALTFAEVALPESFRPAHSRPFRARVGRHCNVQRTNKRALLSRRSFALINQRMLVPRGRAHRVNGIPQRTLQPKVADGWLHCLAELEPAALPLRQRLVLALRMICTSCLSASTLREPRSTDAILRKVVRPCIRIAVCSTDRSAWMLPLSDEMVCRRRRRRSAAAVSAHPRSKEASTSECVSR